jgi:hypothetical protein
MSLSSLEIPHRQTCVEATFRIEWLPNKPANQNSSHLNTLFPKMDCAMSFFALQPPPGTVTLSENENTFGEAMALGFDFKFTSNHNPKLTITQKAACILPRTTCHGASRSSVFAPI